MAPGAGHHSRSLIEIGIRQKTDLHDCRVVCSSSRARVSLSRRLAGSGSAMRFPSAHFSLWTSRYASMPRLICQVVSYRAVDFFKAKKLEILGYRLGRLAAAERMDNRIERDSRPAT